MRFLANLLGIGKATRTDDSSEVQAVQVTVGSVGMSDRDRVSEDVPRLTEYGFTSLLPDDAEVLVIRRNGERQSGTIIATQHRASRPTGLLKGEVWHYDMWGHAVKFTKTGVVIDGAGDVVTVTNASKIRAECDIETTGDIISRADGVRVSLNELRDAYDVHDHPPIAGTTTWGSGPPNEQV